MIFFYSCTDSLVEQVDELLIINITAKDKVEDVLNKAKNDIAQDVKLALIYGRNVNQSGEINLLDFSSTNAFIYGVNSASLSLTEIYMPVYGSSPIKSPISLTSVLELIKDENSRTIIEKAFELISTISIENYGNIPDSDIAVRKGLDAGGANFISNNSNVKIDIFIMPSKSISDDGLENTSDWVIHFYNDSNSVLYWYRTSNNSVIEL